METVTKRVFFLLVRKRRATGTGNGLRRFLERTDFP